jgi:hypothetical protein
MPVRFPFDVTVDRLSVFVGSPAASTGAVVRLGIRNDLSGRPGTVLLDAGTVSTAAVTTAYVTINVSQALTANTLYWLSATPQGTPSTRCTFRSTTVYPLFCSQLSQSTNTASVGYRTSSTSNGTGSTTGALGSTFTVAGSVSVTESLVWMLRLA